MSTQNLCTNVHSSIIKSENNLHVHQLMSEQRQESSIMKYYSAAEVHRVLTYATIPYEP